MTDEVGRVAEPAHEEEEGEHPKGTLFLMLLFLIAMVAMWGYIYVMMLQAA